MTSKKIKDLEIFSNIQLERLANFMGFEVTLVDGKPFSQCEGMLLPTRTVLLSVTAQNSLLIKLRKMKVNINFGDGITGNLECVSLDFKQEEFSQESKTHQRAFLLAVWEMLIENPDWN